MMVSAIAYPSESNIILIGFLAGFVFGLLAMWLLTR